MPPRKGTHRKPERPIGDPKVRDGFHTWVPRYLEWLAVRAFSPRTISNRRAYIGFLVDWLEERAVVRPGEVTKPLLDRYQRHLYYYRQPNGRPLSFRAQHQRLVTVRAFFKWLARQNVIPANPASELELPRLPHRLPPPVLTHNEIETVMQQPDLNTHVGIRDRAIMEVLYSTGIRRTELAKLKLVDFDAERLTLMIREGKGGRDRLVPIGERAILWTTRYLDQVRPQWALSPDESVLFLSMLGESLHPDGLTARMRNYIRAADIGKGGACHAFRHAMATAMLDAGADIRSIQEILGHASLESTQVYTHVSIRKLQAVHAATHPAALLGRPKPQPDPTTDDAKAELLNALAGEQAAEADVADETSNE